MPLTSSKVEYLPPHEQRQVFKHLKSLCTKGPLFNNLIDKQAEKFSCIDMASATSVLGALLDQKIKTNLVIRFSCWVLILKIKYTKSSMTKP